MKVKTFTQSLDIFRAAAEIDELDRLVNNFIVSNKIKRIIGVSDTTTAGDSGTIGIIRVLAYED